MKDNIKSALKAVLTVMLCILCLVGCNKKPKPGDMDLSGEWHLKSFSAGNAEEAEVDVYLAFDNQSKAFALYQRLGEGHYSFYEGSFLLKNGILSGTYKDGSNFACSYTVTLEGDVLTLTSRDVAPEEICIYIREAIPASVKKDAQDYGTKSVTLIPFL